MATYRKRSRKAWSVNANLRKRHLRIQRGLEADEKILREAEEFYAASSSRALAHPQLSDRKKYPRAVALAYLRALKSFLFPATWLQWVNMERCCVELHNDPSGEWTLNIGNRAQPEMTDRSLRRLCWRMFWSLESDPEWYWTTDWFRR